MRDETTIQYLLHEEIDKVKWDACMQNAGNGLIYGYSYYLDHMACRWDALVLYSDEENYEAVMPLTWNRKYGISYLYQPFLTAQLGVFGNNLDKDLLEKFLLAVPSKFWYWDIYLNHGNCLALEKFDLYLRSNYTLPLNKSYPELFQGYRENVQRNIKKSLQAGCRAERDIDVEKVIELARQQMQTFTKESAEHMQSFRNLYHFLHPRRLAVTYGIYLKDELLASCVFFFSHHRAYYILVGNHPNGKTLGASHALIDAFIKDHAGKEMLLDFEGSDIRNLAFFYSSFGAMEETYSAIRLNKLPFYLKWLKS